MRAVIQRTMNATVKVRGEICGKIDRGLLVLLGIEEQDNDNDIQWLAGKISRLRIFDDKLGTMNLSVVDAGAEVMVVSQFTLHASTKKGNRPSYIRAARPEKAEPLYLRFVESLSGMIGKPVPTGRFGEMMEVSLINDGPVTLIIDSRNPE